MNMGGPGDHPIGDLIHWGTNRFPDDIARMLRKLHALDSGLRNRFALESYDWAEGKNLDGARAKLSAELAKHGVEIP